MPRVAVGSLIIFDSPAVKRPRLQTKKKRTIEKVRDNYVGTVGGSRPKLGGQNPRTEIERLQSQSRQHSLQPMFYSHDSVRRTDSLPLYSVPWPPNRHNGDGQT